jgi:hypothetical protein
VQRESAGDDRFSRASRELEEECRWCLARWRTFEMLVPQSLEAKMKVLVATNATQGKRLTDANGCLEGEIVFPPRPCLTSRQDLYGECACGRSFFGIETDGMSTTARIEELVGYSRDDYIAAIYASRDHDPECTCLVGIESVVDNVLEQAERLPVGAIVERHLRQLNVRALRPQEKPR